MSLSETDQLGLAFRFDVVIDGFDLGSWSTCKGLGVTFKHKPVKELGQHAYVGWVPDRADYTKVMFQRAMKAGDWATTKAWLESVAGDGWLTTGSKANTATVTLKDASLAEVASWTLKNALPSAWKAPQFDASGKAIALESLELLHEGFLDD